jgi:hypothetical protein
MYHGRAAVKGNFPMAAAVLSSPVMSPFLPSYLSPLLSRRGKGTSGGNLFAIFGHPRCRSSFPAEVLSDVMHERGWRWPLFFRVLEK